MDDYPVTVFFSREGYFKKITPQSLRMNSEQKYKDGDGLKQSFETTNRASLLVFTDRQQCYKTRLSDFDDTKASVLGSYLPTVLGMDDGENALYIIDPGDYTGSIIFFYENGKASRIELSGYATKTNRKKLTNAYSDKSPLKALIKLDNDVQIAAYSTEGRAIVFNTVLLAPKSSKSSQGVALMTLKKKYSLETAVLLENSAIKNLSRYRIKNIPAAGALLREEDMEEQQLSLLD